MIARVSFGGGLDVQMAAGVMSIMSLIALGMAYYNIKKLQIDQHRAWMLRAWFYVSNALPTHAGDMLINQMCSIITLRLIMIIMAKIITRIGGYYTTESCAKIAYIYRSAPSQNFTLSLYPDCESYFSGTDSDKHVLVAADMNGMPEQIGAALNSCFGAAAWLAIAMHAVGVELYVSSVYGSYRSSAKGIPVASHST